MGFYTFKGSVNDYCKFDEMVQEWNEEHRIKKRKITLRSLPFKRPGPRAATRYNLRAKPSQKLAPSKGLTYTLVDPRQYEQLGGLRSEHSGGRDDTNENLATARLKTGADEQQLHQSREHDH